MRQITTNREAGYSMQNPITIVSYAWYNRIEIECLIKVEPHIHIVNGSDGFRAEWVVFPTVFETALIHSAVSRIN